MVAKIRCLRRWTGREDGCEMKVSELIKMTCKTDYEEKFKHRWERVRGEVVGGGGVVEEE